MKSLLRYAFIFVVMTLFAVPLAAQDGTLVPLDAESTVTVPDGWTVFPADTSNGFLNNSGSLTANYVTDNTVTMLVLTPLQVTTVLGGYGLSDLNRLMAEIYAAVYDIDFEGALPVEELQIGGAAAVRFVYPFELAGVQQDAEVYLVVAKAETQAVFFVSIFGATGTLDAAREDIDAILGSLDAGQNPSGGVDISNPCLVSTGKAQTVVVRVGPGENRGVITYLKADQDFTVQRRFEASDGAVWYRLAKDEVDPGTSAAELWLAAADVDATGDCDNLGEADAPPLRPVFVPGATLAPGQTVGLVPDSGAWVIVYQQLGVASCRGGASVSFNIADLGQPTSETVELYSAPDGSYISYGAYFFSRLNETAYLGDSTISDINTQVYYFPESAAQMRVEIRFNFVIEGFACSATINGSADKQ